MDIIAISPEYVLLLGLSTRCGVVLHDPLLVVEALGDGGLVGVVERGGRADHGGRGLRPSDSDWEGKRR